ncbi:MAG: aminopeptidase P N-terminal domain-containing protein, partial [Fusobacterium varium]
MLGREIYIQRREVLKKNLGKGVVILPGNNESPRNYKDNCYSFNQDSTFLYYFGMDIPSLIGVIDIDNNKEYIFGTDFTLDDIVWMGEQKLLKTYAEEVGIENFIEMSEFEKFTAQLKKDKREILLIPQYRADNIMKLSKALELDPFKYDEYTSLDLIKAIIEQRNVKSQIEIDEIEKAV